MDRLRLYPEGEAAHYPLLVEHRSRSLALLVVGSCSGLRLAWELLAVAACVRSTRHSTAYRPRSLRMARMGRHWDLAALVAGAAVGSIALVRCMGRLGEVVEVRLRQETLDHHWEVAVVESLNCRSLGRSHHNRRRSQVDRLEEAVVEHRSCRLDRLEGLRRTSSADGHLDHRDHDDLGRLP